MANHENAQSRAQQLAILAQSPRYKEVKRHLVAGGCARDLSNRFSTQLGLSTAFRADAELKVTRTDGDKNTYYNLSFCDLVMHITETWNDHDGKRWSLED